VVERAVVDEHVMNRMRETPRVEMASLPVYTVILVLDYISGIGTLDKLSETLVAIRDPGRFRAAYIDRFGFSLTSGGSILLNTPLLALLQKKTNFTVRLQADTSGVLSTVNTPLKFKRNAIIRESKEYVNMNGQKFLLTVWGAFAPEKSGGELTFNASMDIPESLRDTAFASMVSISKNGVSFIRFAASWRKAEDGHTGKLHVSSRSFVAPVVMSQALSPEEEAAYDNVPGTAFCAFIKSLVGRLDGELTNDTSFTTVTRDVNMMAFWIKVGFKRGRAPAEARRTNMPRGLVEGERTMLATYRRITKFCQKIPLNLPVNKHFQIVSGSRKFTYDFFLGYAHRTKTIVVKVDVHQMEPFESEFQQRINLRHFDLLLSMEMRYDPRLKIIEIEKYADRIFENDDWLDPDGSEREIYSNLRMMIWCNTLRLLKPQLRLDHTATIAVIPVLLEATKNTKERKKKKKNPEDDGEVNDDIGVVVFKRELLFDSGTMGTYTKNILEFLSLCSVLGLFDDSQLPKVTKEEEDLFDMQTQADDLDQLSPVAIKPEFFSPETREKRARSGPILKIPPQLNTEWRNPFRTKKRARFADVVVRKTIRDDKTDGDYVFEYEYEIDKKSYGYVEKCTVRLPEGYPIDGPFVRDLLARSPRKNPILVQGEILWDLTSPEDARVAIISFLKDETYENFIAFARSDDGEFEHLALQLLCGMMESAKETVPFYGDWVRLELRDARTYIQERFIEDFGFSADPKDKSKVYVTVSELRKVCKRQLDM
jgi:hypothetical protein